MLKRKVIFVLVGFGYLSPITTHVPVEKFFWPLPLLLLRRLLPLAYQRPCRARTAGHADQ